MHSTFLEDVEKSDRRTAYGDLVMDQVCRGLGIGGGEVAGGSLLFESMDGKWDIDIPMDYQYEILTG